MGGVVCLDKINTGRILTPYWSFGRSPVEGTVWLERDTGNILLRNFSTVHRRPFVRRR